MKAEVTYTIALTCQEIDLEDYGHGAEVKFEDLTEEQRNEIGDSLRVENYIMVGITTIKD